MVEGAALRVHHHIRGMGLKELRGQPEPCLARAGRADDAGVQVAGVGGYLRAGVHGKKLRPGENNIVLKFGVYKRLYILLCSPAGGAVLRIPPEFLCLLDFGLYQQIHPSRTGEAHQQVNATQSRPVGFKGFGEGVEHPHELCPEVCAGGDPVGRPDFGEKPEHKEVRQVWEHIFSDFVTQRPSFTASLVRCFSFACVLICSVKFRS